MNWESLSLNLSFNPFLTEGAFNACYLFLYEVNTNEKLSKILTYNILTIYYYIKLIFSLKLINIKVID